jgi:hypothetical protein
MPEVIAFLPRDLSQIRQAFDTYWRRISTFNLKAMPLWAGGLTVRLEDSGQILVETPEDRAFSFRGLTARRDDRRREDYDVFIQIRQWIRGVREADGGTRREVARSNLRIQYVETRPAGQAGGGGPCRGFHGLHFDFLNPPDAFHPVVHAQVHSGCIPEAAVGRHYACPPEAYRADVPRIPTPPIDLPTIVYVITNDHLLHKGLDRQAVEETLRGIRDAAQALPRFAMDTFPDGKEMPYTWWYKDHP